MFKLLVLFSAGGTLNPTHLDWTKLRKKVPPAVFGRDVHVVLLAGLRPLAFLPYPSNQPDHPTPTGFVRGEEAAGGADASEPVRAE